MRFTSLGQRRQVLFDYQPGRAEVDAQIAVDEHVAKPGEFAPRDLRLGALDLAGQALARFSQGLQIADHGVLHQTRSVESDAFVYSRIRSRQSLMCANSTRSASGLGFTAVWRLLPHARAVRGVSSLL